MARILVVRVQSLLKSSGVNKFAKSMTKKIFARFGVVLFGVICLLLLVLGLVQVYRSMAAYRSGNIISGHGQAQSPLCPTDEWGNMYFDVGSDEDGGSIESSCVFSIKKGANEGLVKYQSGTLRVYSAGEELFSMECTEELAFDGTDSFECDPRHYFIYFEDVTNDGFIDIQMQTYCGAYQCSYNYYIFDPERNAFEKSDVLSNLIYPEFDPATKTIDSHSKWRGIGDEYSAETYTLQTDHSYIKTDICEQYQIDSEDFESDYLYVCKKWNGREFATTAKEIIPREDILPE